MIKVFQIAVDGVGIDNRFYEAHTAEKAIEDFKKDYIEEYERDFGSEDRVEAILYDEYKD